jgi:hypothetical protein
MLALSQFRLEFSSRLGLSCLLKRMVAATNRKEKVRILGSTRRRKVKSHKAINDYLVYSTK